MAISKSIGSVVLATLVAATGSAVAGMQCVSIVIPEFNLAGDENCAVAESALIRSELPDQIFFNDLEIQGFCFTIVSPNGSTPVGAVLTNEQTGDSVEAEITGVAGLTLNAFNAFDENGDPIYIYSPPSFTAASEISIAIDGKYVGTIVTRDAGTEIIEGGEEGEVKRVAAARLSIAAGTKKLRKARGYIDEVGEEFNPVAPALATGRLCGNGLANSLIK